MNNLNFPITVVQMKTNSGVVRENLKKMLAAISVAKKEGSQVVVFPELATSGYMLGDRWEHNQFIKEIEVANEALRTASKGIVVIFGSVVPDWKKIGEDGRVRKYNAVCIAENGKWVSNGTLVGFIPKTNLPKYRIFDDARHFYPSTLLAYEMGVALSDMLRNFTVTIKGKKVSLALSVCEDLWEDEYITKPSVIYRDQHPDLLIDISQSPWTLEKWRARDTMLIRRVGDSKSPILYVSSVGVQNNGKNLVLFDGTSCCVNQEGRFIWRAPQYLDTSFTCNFAALNKKHRARLIEKKHDSIKELYDALIYTMREFYSPFKKVVIGLSGGIDSALSLALLVEAIGKDKVLTINMPTQYNSKTTQNLAKECAKRFGVTYKVIPIGHLYEEQLAIIGSNGGYDFNATPMIVKENIQARLRGQILASVAAAEGGVFTNNGNKTETALNYFTLYGDAAGAASFLGDLWKQQVYALSNYINVSNKKELIPKGIIKLVPSAELSDAQNVDEGKGDPIFYEYHDELLRMFTEGRSDPTDILGEALKGDASLEKLLGCKKGVIKKYFRTKKDFVDNLEWAWKNYTNEFKRVQLPPVFITSRRAFGFDRRDTIASAYFTEEYLRLKKQYLK